MPKFTPATHSEGCVLFGISRPETSISITRIAVLLSHYYKALPLAIHVAGGEKPQDILSSYADLEGKRLFEIARAEASRLGYPLRTYSEFAPGATEGIRQAAEREQPVVIVLGHPSSRRTPSQSGSADLVPSSSKWPLIFVRLDDSEVFGRILVPLRNPNEIASLQPVLRALSLVGRLQVTLLDLTSSKIPSADSVFSSKDFKRAAGSIQLQGPIVYKTASKKSLAESILEAAQAHDLVVMSSDYLAENDARDINFSTLLIRGELRSE